jgi:hypothetical protein
MSQTYFTLITDIGQARLAEAAATGSRLNIEKMAVGDGNGAVPVPTPAQTRLVNECYRARINSLSLDPKHPNRIIIEMTLPETVGGFWVRELGLVNDKGEFVVVANTPPSYKPLKEEGSGRTQLLRLIVVATDASVVELKTDPEVVMASREFVLKTVDTALARLDLKQSVRAATVGPIALAGLQAVNGVALNAGDRVLVKDQADAATNGLYLAARDDWQRVADADENREVTANLLVAVEEGATLADTLWQLTTNGPIELGVTPLVFEQVAGANGVAPGTYTKVTVDRRGLVIGGGNPTSLAGYGITDAYTQAQSDERFQAKLGYVPVHQGGGTEQGNNTVYLGWDVEGRGLRVTIDKTDMGTLWYSSNFDPSKKADKGNSLAAYGILNAYTKAEVYSRGEADLMLSFKANLNQVYTRTQTDQLLREKANTAEVYNKSYVDQKLSERPTRDGVNVLGFAGRQFNLPYMRHEDSGLVCQLEPRLGFTPVRQGGGHGQGSNTVYIGHGSGGPRITVDNTDFGDLVTDHNLASKVANLGLSGIGSYAFARAINGPGQMNQGHLISGSQLLFGSTRGSDGAANNSGLIGGGTWRLHGAATIGERSLWQRIG